MKPNPFESAVEHVRPIRAERNLFAAVLERAVTDAHTGSKQIRREALYWFEDESEEPFGFRWLCDSLGLGSVERDRIRDFAVYGRACGKRTSMRLVA
jgi:hypothetical protein